MTVCIYFSVEYGYVKIVSHENRILNVTAINISHQNTSQDCIRTCLDFPNCWSVNVKQQTNNVYECHILGTDRFRNSSNFVSTTDAGHFHYSIDVRECIFLIQARCLLGHYVGLLDTLP